MAASTRGDGCRRYHRIAVTIEVGGAIEIRTFDLRTLKPAGRLKFATEP